LNSVKFQYGDFEGKAGWQQPIIKRKSNSIAQYGFGVKYVDAAVPNTRQPLHVFQTPSIKKGNREYRITDKFNKTAKKAIFPSNHTFNGTITSISTKYSDELVYNPMHIKDTLIRLGQPPKRK